VVGAKGFEPSTSWSRTMKTNSINALLGIAYGTRAFISIPLVVRSLYVVPTGPERKHSLRSRGDQRFSSRGAERRRQLDLSGQFLLDLNMR
jgi:hypothetical protein